MNRVIAVLVLLVVVVAAVGFYRGWFTVALDKTDGNTHVTGTVDNGKIEADKKEAIGKVESLRQPKAAAGSTGTRD